MPKKQVSPIVWILIGLGLGIFLMAHMQWRNNTVAKAIESVKTPVLTPTLPAPTPGPSPLNGTSPMALLGSLWLVTKAKYNGIRQKTSRKAQEAYTKMKSWLTTKKIISLILAVIALVLFIGMLIPGRGFDAKDKIAPIAMRNGDRIEVKADALLGDGGIESGAAFKFVKVGTAEFIDGKKDTGDIFRRQNATFTVGTWILESRSKAEVNLAGGEITIRRWKNPLPWMIGFLAFLTAACLVLGWERITLPKFGSKKTTTPKSPTGPRSLADTPTRRAQIEAAREKRRKEIMGK